MKRSMTILLTAALSLCLCACGGSNVPADTQATAPASEAPLATAPPATPAPP